MESQLIPWSMLTKVGLDPNAPVSETMAKLIVFYGLNFHYLLFFIGFLVRYQRHKNLGFNNLNDPRPTTYKVKIVLQMVMAFFTLAMVVDTSVNADGKNNIEPLAVVYVLYSGLWLLGIYLQFFEYKRGIPHAWYTHQMFWIMSSVMNVLIMAALFYLFKVHDFENELPMKVKYLVCHSIFILLSVTLAYMGIRYKREYPQHLRNYLSSPNPVKSLNEPLLNG